MEGEERGDCEGKSGYVKRQELVWRMASEGRCRGGSTNIGTNSGVVCDQQHLRPQLQHCVCRHKLDALIIPVYEQLE